MRKIQKMCDSAAILEDGKLTYFPDLDEAIHYHQSKLGGEFLDDDDD